MEVLYEDNHVIIVNKAAGEIVQGDKTGDRTLADEVKAYIKQKYNKPGEVFLGTVHRLDRPVSGLVVFARTSKALTRLNEMFRRGDVHKTYHAIVPLISERPHCTWPTQVGEFVTLTHFLTRDEKRNKAFAHHHEVSGAKRAVLDLGLLKNGERTRLVEIHLHTGRHHQIRCQLATIETFAMQIVDFLLENDVKALVIACNTIAAVAGQKIRQKAGNMPVLDVISAGAQAALNTTRNNKIGIIATNTTVNSNAYARAIHAQNPDTLVRTQATPLLVPLVEEGWLDHEVTRLTVREYLKPLLVDDIDTLVLGCTHFPLLKPLIGKEAQNVALVDSAITTAEATAQALAQAGLLNTAPTTASTSATSPYVSAP